MKKILAILLALAMVLALAACGSAAQAPAQQPAAEEPAAPATEAPVEAPEEPTPAASVPAGTYMYYEDKGDMGATPWTLELREDGSCTITEANMHIGDQIHDCEWTDNGDGSFVTGAWVGGANGPKSDFFAEDGSCTWTLGEDGLVNPVDGIPSLTKEAYEQIAAAASSDKPDGPPANGPEGESGPPANGPVGPIAAGTYTYEEDKGDMGVIPWTVEIREDGTCTITEKNDHIGDQIHECTWTDNGDGTFTTGAWEGGANGPKSDFFAEDGSCTWRTTGPDTCEPVTE